MEYDVILQRNHVFIGMEDVSVTYRNAETTEGVSLEDAKKVVSTAAAIFANSEQVQRLKGKKSYYPIQWDMPCRAIITPHGAVDFHITNYSDLRKANQLGALDISFTSDLDKTLETITALTA